MSLDRPKRVISVDPEAYARNQEFIKQAEERLRLFREMNEQGRLEDERNRRLLELSKKVKEGEEAKRMLAALSNNRPQIAGLPAASPVFEPTSTTTRIEELGSNQSSTRHYNAQPVPQNYPATVNPSQLTSGFQPVRADYSHHHTAGYQNQTNNTYMYQPIATFPDNSLPQTGYNTTFRHDVQMGQASTSSTSYQEPVLTPYSQSHQINLPIYQTAGGPPYLNQNPAPHSTTQPIYAHIQEPSGSFNLPEPGITEAKNVVSLISVAEVQTLFQRTCAWVKDVPPASYCEIPHTRCAVHKTDDGRIYVQTPPINGIPKQFPIDHFFKKWKEFIEAVTARERQQQQMQAQGSSSHQPPPIAQPNQAHSSTAAGPGLQQVLTAFQAARSSIGVNVGTSGGNRSSGRPTHNSSVVYDAQRLSHIEPQMQLQHPYALQARHVPQPHPQTLPQRNPQRSTQATLQTETGQSNPQMSVPQPDSRSTQPTSQTLRQTISQRLPPPQKLPQPQLATKPQDDPSQAQHRQTSGKVQEPHGAAEGTYNSPIVVPIEIPRRRGPGDADKKRLAKDLLFALGKRTRPDTPPDEVARGTFKKHVTEEMAQPSGSNTTSATAQKAPDVAAHVSSDVAPPSGDQAKPRPVGPSLSSFAVSGPSKIIEAPPSSSTLPALPPPPPARRAPDQHNIVSNTVSPSSTEATVRTEATTSTSADAAISPLGQTGPSSSSAQSILATNPSRILPQTFRDGKSVVAPQTTPYQSLALRWTNTMTPSTSNKPYVATTQPQEVPVHSPSSDQPAASSSTTALKVVEYRPVTSTSASSLKVTELQPVSSTSTLSQKAIYHQPVAPPSTVSQKAIDYQPVASTSTSSLKVTEYWPVASTPTSSLKVAEYQPAASTSTSSLKVIDRQPDPLFLPESDESETERNGPRKTLRVKAPKVPSNRAYVLIPTPSEEIRRHMQHMQKTRKGKQREQVASVATSVTGEVSESEEDFSVPLEKINVIDKAAQEAIRLSASRMDVLPCKWDGCDVVANCAQTLIKHLDKAHKPPHSHFTCLWTQCGRRCHRGENHVEKHASSPHRCAYKGCSETFRSGSSLLKHFRRNHKSGELKPSARPVAMPMKPVPKGPTEPLPAYLCMSRVAQPTPLTPKQHALLGPWVLRNINESDTSQIWQKKKTGQARHGSTPGGNLGVEYQYLITRTSRPSSYLSEPAQMQLADIGMNADDYEHAGYGDALTVFSRPRPGDDVIYLNSRSSPLFAAKAGLNNGTDVSQHHDGEGRK